MKFISILLLSCFTTLINCQKVFINLQPFQTNQCFLGQQNPIGVGYNVIANQCTMNMGNFLYYEKSYKFNETSIYFGTSVDASGLTVIYGNYYDSKDCTGTPTYGFIGYNEGCIETTLYEFINSSIPYESEFPFVSVSISGDVPVIPIDAQVYQVFNNSENKGGSNSQLECSSTNNEFLFSAFVTSNYEIDYDTGVKEIFTCNDNHQPIVKYCGAHSSSCETTTPTCRLVNDLTTTVSCNYNLN